MQKTRPGGHRSHMNCNCYRPRSIIKQYQAINKKFHQQLIKYMNMKKRFLHGLILCIAVMSGCTSKDQQFDASGTFETDEVIVSSELPGKILSFNVEEGNIIPKDSIVGTID